MSLRIGKRNFKGIFNEKKDSWVLLLMEEIRGRSNNKERWEIRKKEKYIKGRCREQCKKT